MADSITRHFSEFIQEQISRKYMMFSPSTTTYPQPIDSYCPHVIITLMYDAMHTQSYHNVITESGQEMRRQYFRKKDFAISEGFANRFNIKKASVELLAAILGFNRTTIKNLFIAVAKKKLDLVYVGFGGTGVNTHYWLSELAIWCNVREVFESGLVMDEDVIDYTNILRFPMDMNKYHQKMCGFKKGAIEPMFKVNIAEDYAGLFKYDLSTLSKNLSPYFVSSTLHEMGINKDNKDKSKVSASKNSTIFYGAPDIPTREMLSDVNFIAATHGDNECSLHIRPKVDTQLQQESYGMIQLNAFFMNQLRMAIGLLELLARDDFNEVIKSNDNEIFKFNFYDFYAKNITFIRKEFDVEFVMRNSATRQG